jgi:hypothetical protein
VFVLLFRMTSGPAVHQAEAQPAVPTAPPVQPQTLLVLCGLPGSGEHSSKICSNTHSPNDSSCVDKVCESLRQDSQPGKRSTIINKMQARLAGVLVHMWHAAGP